MTKLAIALLLLGATAAMAAIAPRTMTDNVRLFADFKQTYGRQYTPSQEAHAFSCFTANLDLIDQRNAKDTARHVINQFADLCADEFAKYYLGLRPNNNTRKAVPATGLNIPVGGCPAINWVSRGVVTGVKNQGQCGSCWSFSATGNMEGQWAITGHGLVSLSEEELVQCSQSEGNQGCNGGLMDQAFAWVMQNGGIDAEANYPYTSGGGYTGQCNTGLLGQKAAAIASYQNLPQDEGQMANWMCSGGPISIGVDATSWQTYGGGVMTDCGFQQMDHGVLAVGFDAQSNPPFWIVKNSWGASWGEGGYILLEMGTNQCGITTAPSSSVV